MPRRTIWSLLAAALLCVMMLPATARAADYAPEELVVANVTVDVTQDGYWTTDPATGELTETQDAAAYNVRYDASEGALYLNDATIGKGTVSATGGTHSIYAFGESGVSLTIHLAGESHLSSGVPIYVTSDSGKAVLNIADEGTLNAEGTAVGNGGIFLMSGGTAAGSGSYLNITDGADVVSNCSESTAVMFYARPGGEAILTVMGASLTANGWYPGGDARGIFFSRLGTGTANFYLRLANNAVVRANKVAVLSGHTLQHQYSSASGGTYFNGDAGTVYGPVTLQEDLSIGEGEALSISKGASLTIPEGVSLINEGAVTGASGSIVNNGTIYNGEGATLPNGITGSGTIEALPAYVFECPGELELQESSGGGYYAAKGALSLTDDPVLGEDGRIIVYATYSAVTELQNEEDLAYSIPLNVVVNDGSSTCHLQTSNEIRVISVFDGGQSAPYTLYAYADPMAMNDVPNGTYGGTITLYVGYTKDATVQFGDEANVELNTLTPYTVDVTLENTLGLSVAIQPQSADIKEGEIASFSIVAEGGATKAFQWQVSTDGGTSWSDIAGATDATYTTQKTTMDLDGNQYRCVVTSGQVAIESDPATLIVNHVHKPASGWTSDESGHWHACEACGDELDYATHEPEIVGKQNATCTEEGYTGDTVCSVCGYVIAKGKTIPATGHDFIDGVCTVCGSKEPAEDKETIPATGDVAPLACALAGIFGIALVAAGLRKRTSR